MLLDTEDKPPSRPGRGSAWWRRRAGRRARVWLSAAAAGAVLVAAVGVPASATVIPGVNSGYRGPYICQPDGVRTATLRNTYYYVRNDVFSSERECIKQQVPGVGFTVYESNADTYGGDTEAFPETVYGCAWGLCTHDTQLPRRVYAIRHLSTSWSTSWRNVSGHFNVAYDIWFGHLRESSGQARGAELMIWLGTKGFADPWGDPEVLLDGSWWWYARHRACNQFGCWNYVLFRKVDAATSVSGLKLLPFIHVAERHNQISNSWFLKSIQAGFEIWRGGLGLKTHSFSVHLQA
jgi:hypothetical protein